MLNDRVVINKSFGNSLVAFIGNPLVALIVTIILSVFFYVISVSQKMPCYFFTNTKLVAEQKTDKLKLNFDKRSIKNLYSIDVVFWNNGGQSIDHNDFIESKPTILTADGAVQLLGSDELVKSRAELKFSNYIAANELHIKLIDDEALEQGDGVAFRVYYTTDNSKPYKFSVKSRIKGTKQGFVYKDLYRVSKAKHSNFVLIGWSTIILLISIRVITLLLFKKPVVFRKSELIVLFIALAFWSYYTYEYLYFTVDLGWYKTS